MLTIISKLISIVLDQGRYFLPIGSFILCLSGCAYQFGRSGAGLNPEIRSIAVEAVYDTSREIIPHEVIWSAIQQQVARSGKVYLASQKDADAIITVWVTKAQVAPSGTPSREPLAKDPSPTTGVPARPDEYRNLRRAGSWTIDENLNFTVEVELHNLRRQELIKRQSYNYSTNFKSLRPVTITSSTSAYLHYEEAMEAKFKDLANQLAQRIVSDFSL